MLKLATMTKAPLPPAKKKKRVRRHYIPEWAAKAGKRKVDIATDLEIDKSQLTRWFQGQLPQQLYQQILAGYFGIAPEALLRHPDDVWFSDFTDGRDDEERQRIRATLETAFPSKTVQ